MPLRTPWRLHEAAWPQGAAWSRAGGARARRTRFSGGRRLRSQPRGGSKASREPGPVPLAQTGACRDLLTGLLRPEGLPPVEAGRTVFTPPPLSLSPSREAEPPCTPWLQPEPGVVRCDTSPPVTRSPPAGPLSPGCKARCGPAGAPSAAQPAGRPPSPHGHGPRRTCARAASTARPPGRLPELRPGPQRAPCPVATSAQPRADGARARPDWPSVPAPRVTGTETFWAPSAAPLPTRRSAAARIRCVARSPDTPGSSRHVLRDGGPKRVCLQGGDAAPALRAGTWQTAVRVCVGRAGPRRCSSPPRTVLPGPGFPIPVSRVRPPRGGRACARGRAHSRRRSPRLSFLPR